MPGGRIVTGQTTRALVACLIVMWALAPAAHARMTSGERAVMQRVNALRADYGAKPLRADGRLAKAADAHSRDMLRRDFFAHSSSNGVSPHDRIRRFRKAELVGETLAYMPDGGGTSARAVVRMWRNSSGHLQTLTHRRFRRIGVSKMRGRIDGRRVTVWTVDLSSKR
jgi:uncharacterized protein YkwD